MARDKYGHYVNDNGVEIRVSTDKTGKDHIDIYDKCPADNPEHGSIHITSDIETGSGSITDTTGESKETTDTSCYLTTACMKNFRDKFVSEEDKKYYYEVAPIIVSEIEKSNNKDKIYKYIYDNVVSYCVNKIEENDFEAAYSRYKNSVLVLEEQLVSPQKQNKCLKKISLIN